MKIEFTKWTLSLFENEYQEVQINETSIKVVTLEGKSKVITFNLDQTESNDENKLRLKKGNKNEESTNQTSELKKVMPERESSYNDFQKDVKNLKDSIENFNLNLINEKDKLKNLENQPQINKYDSSEKFKDISKNDILNSDQSNESKEFQYIPRNKPAKEYQYINGMKVEVIGSITLPIDAYEHSKNKKSRYKQAYKNYY